MIETCIHEPQVRRAAIEDRWTDALRQHVSRCDDCAAAAAVAPFMTAFAAPEVRRRALPDPAVLWLKAKLLRSNRVAERAVRPLNIAQIISYLVIAAGWAGLLTWKWDDVQRLVVSFTPANLAGQIVGINVPLMLVVVVLSSLTVMVGLHAILAEE